MHFTAFIIRSLTVFALLMQMALPFAQAHATSSGTDLAHLICNPSGQSVSSEAQIALAELLEALEPSDDEPPAHDCDRCVTPGKALSAPVLLLTTPTEFQRISDSPKPKSRLETSAPRGPPCGRRAPPSFL